MTFKEWLFKELTDMGTPEKETPDKLVTALSGVSNIKDYPPKAKKTAATNYAVKHCKKK